jgi:hypothetical protein
LHPAHAGLQWFQVAGTQYAAVTSAKSWQDARYTCRINGLDLVTLTSALAGPLNTALQQVVPGASYYIGLTDQALEGVWRWAGGAEPYFLNWDTSSQEPNGGTSANCVQVDQATRKWRDAACTSPAPAICGPAGELACTVACTLCVICAWPTTFFGSGQVHREYKNRCQQPSAEQSLGSKG